MEVKKLIDDNYSQIYEQLGKSHWDLISHIETRMIKSPSAGQLSLDLIFLLFHKLEISRQIHLSILQTREAYQEAISIHDPTKVIELVFFVEFDLTVGLTASEAVEKPAAYDLPLPDVETAERDAHTVAMLHTHPPLPDDILAPSVIVTDDYGNRFGDLYSFIVIRKENQKAQENKRKTTFAQPLLSIIIKEDLEKERCQLLLIRESSTLMELDEAEYIKLLNEYQERLSKAKSGDEVCQILRGMGYFCSYLELSAADFYNYPMIPSVESFKNLLAEILGPNYK
ncbi:hypothetical protein HY612_01870 [Candidatus Roizmanbacteria bacterium]|nr:hypothetical protein [Candidatus Roizmanbacteria bacterium]